MSYVNTKEARNLLRITASSLRRWDKLGKIKTIRTPSGIRLYSLERILEILGQKEKITEKQTAVYYQKNDNNEIEQDYKQSIDSYHNVLSGIGKQLHMKQSLSINNLHLMVINDEWKTKLDNFYNQLQNWIDNKQIEMIQLHFTKKTSNEINIEIHINEIKNIIDKMKKKMIDLQQKLQNEITNYMINELNLYNINYKLN